MAVLEPRGPFDLRQAIATAVGPRAAGTDDVLRLAFAADGEGAPVAAELRQAAPDRPVAVDLRGDVDPDALLAQVARITSLDGDGEAFAALGAADPVLGELQARLPGLRPVLFPSPYEAACWAVVSTRWGRGQAAAARDAIAAAHGHGFKLAGEVHHAWPAPPVLAAALAQGRVTGLPGEKLKRLEAVCAAAIAGDLDAAFLRALRPEAAAAQLGTLRGFGPFYQALVVTQAVGFPDAFGAEEPRLRTAAAALTGAPELDAAALEALAERWRPFRAWAAVLLRTAAERELL